MVLAGLLPVAFVRFVLREPTSPPPPPPPAPLTRRAPWSAFLWGVLAWLLGGLATKAIVAQFLTDLIARSTGPRQWITLGLLTGVFECGLVLLLAAFVPSLRGRATWLRALAFGVGFGAAEALLVSIDGFLPEGPVAPAEPTWDTLIEVGVPFVERFNAVAIHAFACALILLALRTRRQLPFLIAFAYKSLVDALPTETLAPFGVLAIQSVYVAFGIAGLMGLIWLRRRWPAAPTA